MINKQATLMATLLTAAVLTTGASQDRPGPPSAPPQTTSTETPLIAPSARKPFANIFAVPRPRPNAAQPADGIVEVEIQPGPRVVCGMTLLPGNPAIDPKVVVQPRLTKPAIESKNSLDHTHGLRRLGSGVQAPSDRCCVRFEYV